MYPSPFLRLCLHLIVLALLLDTLAVAQFVIEVKREKPAAEEPGRSDEPASRKRAPTSYHGEAIKPPAPVDEPPPALHAEPLQEAHLPPVAPPPPLAPDIELTAFPYRIMPGGEVLLEWRAQNADRVWINGQDVPTSGRSHVRLDRSLRVTATASGAGGEITDSVHIVVDRSPVPAASIVVRPSTIAPGETALMAWRTVHATQQTINGHPVFVEGREVIRPTASCVYDLHAWSVIGEAYASAAVTVTDDKEQKKVETGWIGDGGTPSEVATDRARVHRIHFRQGETGLSTRDLETLTEVADVMRDPQRKLHIVGHTDSYGDEETNELLSARRAEAAKNVLARRFGVPAERMTIEGRGEREPIAPNGTALGREMNRRVEFLFR